uniref:Uncharacterized protein n=1 Tax=Candidatus Kentrum sp. SD TaxID=2126332 RepID=A0A451BR92_9GAMM|nr:MAG: hypothetical protein BECKSD772F_GA0070984_12157 [Candidatus Kentron sp. SD]VFK80793.1 MAG: hypothetical protein BECKSD772D_GA0070982_11573 [Candidatus Kentron sp. SD]
MVGENETNVARFPCDYLDGDVEITRERERHIAESHPELLPEHRKWIASTLADPDQVRTSTRFGNAKSSIGKIKILEKTVSESEPTPFGLWREALTYSPAGIPICERVSMSLSSL